MHWPQVGRKPRDSEPAATISQGPAPPDLCPGELSLQSHTDGPPVATYEDVESGPAHASLTMPLGIDKEALRLVFPECRNTRQTEAQPEPRPLPYTVTPRLDPSTSVEQQPLGACNASSRGARPGTRRPVCGLQPRTVCSPYVVNEPKIWRGLKSTCNSKVRVPPRFYWNTASLTCVGPGAETAPSTAPNSYCLPLMEGLPTLRWPSPSGRSLAGQGRLAPGCPLPGAPACHSPDADNPQGQ